jgi:alanine racemase
MPRPTQAVINLQHLKDNYQLAKGYSQKAYAVIKADAYGHGLIPIAHALIAADGLAVACMDEALQLRQEGVNNSILVLEGGYDEQEWLVAIEHDIEMVLHHQSQLNILLSNPHFNSLKLWLKVNTGMNRLGFDVSECQQVFSQCLQAGLNISVLMSHFSCADDLNNEKTFKQNQLLEAIFEQQSAIWPNLILSNSNSAAIIGWPAITDNISRPGIMLYGSSPLITSTVHCQALKPVMTLSSKIISSHTVKAGESIGYGDSLIVEKDTRVGITAIGYGDGYPRSAPSGTPVWCQGKYLQTLGRISMDMLCIDISEQPDIDIGSEVELWGEHVNVNEIANLCNTISYELFCQLTPRVKRMYK